jgi:hypothetical protein
MPHNVGKTIRKMADERLKHLKRFYALLDKLEDSIGGARTLAACSGRMDWPTRGVYFFREPGEIRRETGAGPRIVRVGTHALKEATPRTLWDRLSNHKGTAKTGGGNHRGSIFRLIVGTALICRERHECLTWGNKSASQTAAKEGELALECEVSRVIGNMPFIWLAIDDAAGPKSLRGIIERNSIALLSNYEKPPLDQPSPSWLGRHCLSERLRDSGLSIRSSGLWNSNHVDESYDPAFLDDLERLIAETESVS